MAIRLNYLSVPAIYESIFKFPRKFPENGCENAECTVFGVLVLSVDFEC
jgi:hypothetical protein